MSDDDPDATRDGPAGASPDPESGGDETAAGTDESNDETVAETDESNDETAAWSDESNDEGAGLVGQIAAGGGFGVAGRVAGKALSVLLQVLLTRYLGPTRYGRYVLGVSVTRIGQRFAQLGLDQSALRYGAIYHGDDDGGLGRLLVATTAASAVASVSTAAVVWWFAGPIARVGFDDPALAPVFRAFAFALPFFVLLELAAAYFQAVRRIGTEQFLTSVFRHVVNLVVVGLAFLAGYGLGGAIAGFVLTGAVSSALAFALLVGVRDPPVSRSSLGAALRRRPGRDEVREWLAFALPMMVVGMSFLLATRMDRIMLGILSDTESVGVYNVAAAVGLQFSLVLSSLISIFKPIIADVSDAGETERVSELYRTVAKWATFGTVPPYLIVVAFATPILSVFGPSFTEARPVLYVLPLAFLFGCVTGPCGALLAMSGRQKLEVGNQVLLVVLNVVLNLLLIPVFGAVGAAAAVVLAAAATNVVQVGFVYALYGFHPFHREHLLTTGATAVVVLSSVTVAVRFGPAARVLTTLVLLAAWGLLFYRQVDERERDLFDRLVA